MVIPRFVGQALAGQPITVYGDGQQSRCFCAVSDVVAALIGLSTEPAAPGRVYNVGSEEETTIMALAELVRELTGSRSPIVTIPYAEAYAPGFEDMQRRVPDTSRVRALLGWQPRLSLQETLQSVIAYEQQGP
jgi:UDP-glucose 4-epimerase